MSTLTNTPPRGRASSVEDPGVSRWNVRRWSVWGAVILVLMVVATYVAGVSGSSERPLDPDNPGEDGMQALAEVLRDQGVEIAVVRGLDNLPSASAGGATVLISSTAYLSDASGADVRAYTQDADSVVILSPEGNLSDVLGVDVETDARSTPTAMAPECDSTFWAPQDRVSRGDTLLDVSADIAREDALTCLPPSPGYNAGGSRSGYWVELAPRSSQPRTVVAGIATALTNAYVVEEANAATGLRLLGSTDRLVWVIPSISDAGDQPPVSLTDVLPSAVVPAAVLVLVALLALTVVRGRRLGRVTTEPLPVLIHAIETTTSRGRLYQEARDRPRALASLQLAARRRLASRLSLAVGSTPEEVVQAVAHATGRPVLDVHRLLVDPTVDDDATLVQIARDVRSLEDGMVTL
ncbi:MAG: DUF4350 domain-containing protein [Ornithinimicrobium sp.]